MRGRGNYGTPSKNNDLRRFVLNTGLICDMARDFPPTADRNQINRHIWLQRLILQHFTMRHPAHGTGRAVLEENYQLSLHEAGTVFD